MTFYVIKKESHFATENKEEEKMLTGNEIKFSSSLMKMKRENYVIHHRK